MIQTLSRKTLAQRSFVDMKAKTHVASKTCAAIKIQAFHRCQKESNAFLAKKQVVVKIQNIWRMAVKRDLFLFQKQAMIMIQTSSRKILAERAFADIKAKHYLTLQTNAAMKIQVFQRCRKERHSFSVKKQVTIRIQNLWRMVLTRILFLRSKTAASKIQVRYRNYKRKNALVSRVVTIQSLARRVIARRIVLERRDESQRQIELASDQLSAETRIASILIVDDLLTKHDCMTYGPYLKKLADRVHSTLNEADSALNEVFRDFVGRDLPAIPLPRRTRIPDSFNASGVKSKDFVGTPVRCNKAPPKIVTSEGSNKYPLSKASPAEERAVIKNAREVIFFLRKKEASVVPQKDSGVDSFEELEARLIEDEEVRHTTGFENFGVATMPSPIRSNEGKPDWDWTAEW